VTTRSISGAVHYGPAPGSLSVPKSAALSALLAGSGLDPGGWAAAADPNSGAPTAVDWWHGGYKPSALQVALQELHDANESNPAAPLLQGIINQM
jgi:hypothetical protein